MKYASGFAAGKLGHGGRAGLIGVNGGKAARLIEVKFRMCPHD
jgi:hypothetical protein